MKKTKRKPMRKRWFKINSAEDLLNKTKSQVKSVEETIYKLHNYKPLLEAQAEIANMNMMSRIDQELSSRTLNDVETEKLVSFRSKTVENQKVHQKMPDAVNQVNTMVSIDAEKALELLKKVRSVGNGENGENRSNNTLAEGGQSS